MKIALKNLKDRKINLKIKMKKQLILSKVKLMNKQLKWLTNF